MKKISIFLIITSFLLGAIFVKNKIFPYKLLQDLKYKYSDIDNFNLEKKYKLKYSDWKNNNNKLIDVVKYLQNINIYSDSNYYNHENDKFLSEYFLIQIPRHNNEIRKFKIKFNNPAEVIRALCSRNNNTEYSSWQEIPTKIAVIGVSCVHIIIVKKDFAKGVHEFTLGGPVASDPIFFKSKKDKNQNFSFEILY